MRTVLLVEDSEECCLVVRRALAGPEISISITSTVRDAKRALEATASGKIDLILLDLGLPDGDGFLLLEFLRANPALESIPVFLLTGKDELSSKVIAFNLGADDYLVKPVNPIELKSRVEMRLRKSAAHLKNPAVARVGNLVLNTSLMRASLVSKGNERPIDLTNKEFKILAFLIQNPDEVYSRSQLVNAVWGDSVHVLDRTVDSHIYGLRKKLGDSAHLIECIPGAGYRFSGNSSEISAPGTDQTKPSSE